MTATAANHAAQPAATLAELRRRLAAAEAERDEAVAQQEAAAEVLQVINSSPGDLDAVFGAILDRAMQLCGAAFGGLVLWRDGRWRMAAQSENTAPAFAEFLATGPISPGPIEGLARVARGEGYVQTVDILASKFYQAGDPTLRAMADLGGGRTALTVPLAKDGEVLGIFSFYRQEVRPFSARQIALAKSFAAQAVIAMENARLLTETREALEQQTATAELLQVINSSPGDLAPVFDAMLEKALHLCDAVSGLLLTFDGERADVRASRDLPAAFLDYLRRERPGAGPDTFFGRSIMTRSVLHSADITAGEPYRKRVPLPVAAVELGGIRAALFVPLLKDNGVPGVFSVFRKEPRAFTDKQIALLQNFAAQAVIAMENARLLGELRERTRDLEESLEYQTATSDVLKVISRSTFDLQPVLDTVAETAARLCEAGMAAIAIRQGDALQYVATFSASPEWAAFLHGRSLTIDRGTIAGRVLLEKDVVHVADLAADADHAVPEAMTVGGVRTLLGVPLLRDGEPVGVIAVSRSRVAPFSGRQIDLIRTFADQAVIAIENTRLLTELRESLEQQQAIAEVLGVINSSPGDLAPVFDAIVDRAMTLCGAAIGLLGIWQGERYTNVTARGVPQPLAEYLDGKEVWPGPREAFARIAAGDGYRQSDLAASKYYAAGDPLLRAMVDLGGARMMLVVPMAQEGEVLGLLGFYRQDVRPFSDQQIALLKNFAAQAVIAMENARLLTETREALEQQTATAEILQVINASPGDLAPVFDAILEKAHHLCDATLGALVTYDGERFRALATRGYPEEYAALLRQPFPPGLAHQQLLDGERLVHVPDMEAVASLAVHELARGLVQQVRARTFLMVPLRKEGRLLGLISATRLEARAFSDKEIALLESFAAQAVIAMENARLLGELRERTHDLEESLEYQTATSDVLKVISRSTFDLQPVLDTVVETAARLCEADGAGLTIREGEVFRYVAIHSVNPEFYALLQARTFVPNRRSMAGRVALAGEAVHVADIAADPEYGVPEAVTMAGIRTLLGVPLLRDGQVVGTIALTRERVAPFSERQIELVRTFADQAAIAIENTRLITETREALEQQQAIAEVLQVINASPGDVTPVFDAMLDRALRLCEAAFGGMYTADGEWGQLVASRNLPPAALEFFTRVRLRTVLGPDRRDGSVVHIADMTQTEAYRRGIPIAIGGVEVAGIRSWLGAPLVKDGAVVGMFAVYRTEVRPFSDKQTALLQNFAAQAVIAMENARLLGELRERTHDLEESLEYQTATSDVLQVISRSTFDLQPVLDTLVQTAARLCEADWALITTRDGEVYRVVASLAVDPELDAILRTQVLAPGHGTLTGRTVLEGRTVHITDISAETEYTLSAVVAAGTRVGLGVPLLREGVVIGTINLARQRAEPFTERQIELVRTFADQAVIAIENTRLLTELRESLEQQQAIAEILQVINRSPGDLQPVFDILLEKAIQVCGAAYGIMNTYDGERFHTAAAHRFPPAMAEVFWQDTPQPGPHSTLTLMIQGRDVVSVDDLTLGPGATDPRRRALIELGGARSYVSVALRKDGVLLGTIAAYRQEVRPFSEKQIALLQSFAAQAVIAMDNARLLDEIRQRQAELRVTFDNMGDGVAMFDAELRLAAWNRNFQQILDLPDDFVAARPSVADYFRYLAGHGEYTADLEAELSRRVADTNEELRFERTRPDGRAIEVRRNPVPGGGFVLMYSDITERKRAEEAVRAARDAAEAALTQLRTAQASLIQSQKMAALGQLTAGIAHEIKNPLNFVNNFAGLSVELLEELQAAAAPGIAGLDEEVRAEIEDTVGLLTGNLDKIAEHGRRADNIVKSMLEHSRGVSGERRTVDLNALVEEALNLAYHGARAQDQNFNVTLERDLGADIAPVELVPQDLTRVFLNLFGNGFYAVTKRKAVAGNGAFRPVLKVATRDLGHAVEVKVRDNGTGIAPELRDRLFQPFFTTKPTGEGTGLGLSISYDIVTQEHGGTIEVDSTPGEFTEFTVRLPRPAVA